MCEELEWRRSYRANKKVHAFRRGSIRPFVAVEALCSHTVTVDQLGSAQLLTNVPMSELCGDCLLAHGIELSEQIGERDTSGKRDTQA